MNIQTAYYTDVGTTKEINQDSLCIQVATVPYMFIDTQASNAITEKIVMAVLCDGMGGLCKGELASASVVNAFVHWFSTELSIHLGAEVKEQESHAQYKKRQSCAIGNDFERLIKKQNRKIATYGKKHHLSMGTTVTAILIVDKHFLVIGHVGDSRVYEIGGDSFVAHSTKKAIQLTQDHTLTGQKIKNGTMTQTEALADPYRHILLQCVGVCHMIQPEIIKLTPQREAVYLICSDGFHNLLTTKELYNVFNPHKIGDEQDMRRQAIKMVEQLKAKEEKDNISVILIKVIA